MAEGGLDKTAGDLEQEITCPICNEHFDNPLILPCSHYYCKKCIQELADRAGSSRPFACPECRDNVQLSQNDADKLPRALSVSRMQEIHSKLVQEKKQAYKMCSKHNDPLKLFCFDCNCLICGQCGLFNHKSHSYKLVKQAAPKSREQLRTKIAPLNKFVKGYTDATTKAQIRVLEIETQNSENTKVIKNWADKYVESIRSCERNLVAEVSKASKQKVNNLKGQITKCEASSATIDQLSKRCERSIQNATDEEFIKNHKHLLSLVDSECKKHKDVKLELVANADVGVELPSSESLKDLCRKGAKMVLLDANPASCTVKLENAEVNKKSRVVFQAMYKNSTACIKPQTVKAEMTSLANGSSICIKGEQKLLDHSIYDIYYTPQIRGRHRIAIAVNSKQVAGSPFSISVKIPPVQLGKPVREMSNLKGAYGVAFSSAGEVLISMAEEIQVFDNSGKKLRSINHNFQSLRGIAVDAAGNIFVMDSGSHCVCKLHKHGHKLRSVGVRGRRNAEFNDPRGLAVIKGQVFICDSGNHRIQVLTRDLQFVKSIGSQGKGNGQFQYVYDIGQDDAGNLYACDYSNHRIQVFSIEGNFLRSFGTNGSSCGFLDRPAGVCVSNGSVFVSEYGNVRVSVFDTKGECKWSFDTGGGFFSGCSVVAVDKDGFVYICDCKHNRVQVF